MPTPRYKRVLLKMSGEALMGNQGYGIDPAIVARVAKEVKQLVEIGVRVGIVIGGGNIFRGLAGAAAGMERASADYMGMLATVLNALALQNFLENNAVDTRVQSAIEMRELAEPYIRRRAIRHLEKGRIVIFAAGTGNPYFTTDTTAALRAAEIEAEAILMGKQGVEGIYDSDPRTNKSAVKYQEVTYQEVLVKNLKVMDSTAIALCMDNHIPIIVYDMMGPDYVVKVVLGEDVGQTYVRGDKK